MIIATRIPFRVMDDGFRALDGGITVMDGGGQEVKVGGRWLRRFRSACFYLRQVDIEQFCGLFFWFRKMFVSLNFLLLF